MRKVLRSAALLASLALATVALAACGGGDDTEPLSAATTSAAAAAQATVAPASPTLASPTSAATVENRPEVEALLKATALRLEDLPSGFTLDEERFTTNEEAADESSDSPGAATLEDMNRFGRILGYEASFSQEASTSAILEGGTLFLQVTTTVYQNSDGADEALEFVREQTSDPEAVKTFEQSFASSAGVEVQDASISPMSFAEVGDDRLAVEVKVSAHSTDLDQDFDFIAQLVGVRRDRVIGALTVVTVNAPPDVGELEDLARTLDERTKDALD